MRLRGDEPPNPPALATWATEVRMWHVRIVLDRRTLQSEALADPRLWYLGCHDADNTELFRHDAEGDELRSLLQHDTADIVFRRQFNSARQPATWTVWPMSSDGQWLTKTMGTIDSARPDRRQRITDAAPAAA
jgi:hypothetical protein